MRPGVPPCQLARKGVKCQLNSSAKFLSCWILVPSVKVERQGLTYASWPNDAKHQGMCTGYWLYNLHAAGTKPHLNASIMTRSYSRYPRNTLAKKSGQ